VNAGVPPRTHPSQGRAPAWPVAVPWAAPRRDHRERHRGPPATGCSPPSEPSPRPTVFPAGEEPDLHNPCRLPTTGAGLARAVVRLPRNARGERGGACLGERPWGRPGMLARRAGGAPPLGGPAARGRGSVRPSRRGAGGRAAGPGAGGAGPRPAGQGGRSGGRRQPPAQGCRTTAPGWPPPRPAGAPARPADAGAGLRLRGSLAATTGSASAPGRPAAPGRRRDHRERHRRRTCPLVTGFGARSRAAKTRHRRAPPRLHHARPVRTTRLSWTAGGGNRLATRARLVARGHLRRGCGGSAPMIPSHGLAAPQSRNGNPARRFISAALTCRR